MPLPAHILEELGRQRLAEQREADRVTRREYVRAILRCFLWMTVGIALLSWSVHTTDLAHGLAAFWGGLIVGNGGICYTLIDAYLRGERRGDW